MKTLRVTICIILIVGVLAMSLSVFAVDTTPSPTPALDNGLGKVTDELLARYIWMCLNAWGIHVEYNNIDGYLDAMESQIITWVLQYLAGLPSAYSINQWIAPWQAEFDYWGNLRLNSSALEDIQDFARWLGLTYDLTDDNEYPVNVTYGIGEYSLYKLNTHYLCEIIDNTGANPPAEIMSSYTVMSYNADSPSIDTSNVYYFVQYDASKPNDYDRYKLVMISDSSKPSFLVESRAYDIYGNRLGAYEHAYTYLSGNNKSGSYYRTIILACTETWYDRAYHIIPANAVIFAGTNDDVYNFLQTALISSNGLVISTGDIVLPDDDESYTIGDSVTIIGDNPEYSVIEWDGNVTVNNLPAIITQRYIPDVGNDSENPGFSVPWQAINGLIQYVAAPAGAIMALVNEAPVEGVIMHYALIGGIIIFGMIRIMREH